MFKVGIHAFEKTHTREHINKVIVAPIAIILIDFPLITRI